MRTFTVAEVRAYLDGHGVGDVNELAVVVAGVWPQLLGGDEAGMTPHKLRRMENVAWEPPTLRFSIERHGAIVAGGGTRAEVQTWEVNLHTGTADVRASSSYRQVRPA